MQTPVPVQKKKRRKFLLPVTPPALNDSGEVESNQETNMSPKESNQNEVMICDQNENVNIDMKSKQEENILESNNTVSVGECQHQEGNNPKLDTILPVYTNNADLIATQMKSESESNLVEPIIQCQPVETNVSEATCAQKSPPILSSNENMPVIETKTTTKKTNKNSRSKKKSNLTKIETSDLTTVDGAKYDEHTEHNPVSPKENIKEHIVRIVDESSKNEIVNVEENSNQEAVKYVLDSIRFFKSNLDYFKNF